MSSTYANDQTKTLRRSILWRTILNAVLFTAVYAAAVFLVELFKPALSNFVFYTVLDGVGYTLYNLLSSLYYLVAAGVYLIGMILVIRAGINRALRYFDALFEAVEGMLVEEGSPIDLPAELSSTALALNGIQAERERSERAAKAAEQRKNELVVYLAHDIKTPLTSIIGYLTLLSESPDMPI